MLLLSAAAISAELPTEQDRLIATGKLWITVKYFHPYLAYRRDIDWDKALLDALPKIRQAKATDEYAAAIRGMLDTLKPGTPNAARSLAHRTWIHYGPNRSAFSVEPGPAAKTVAVEMGPGQWAEVPLSEPLTPNLPAFPAPPPERDYSASAYPSTEHRILAAYKIWGAVRNFFAYRDLMDDDWDVDFAEFLPKFIGAKDAREYNLAVAEAVTHLDDSNAVVSSRELNEYFGPATPGLRLRLFEKKPLITEITDDEVTKAGVQIGDIVTRVDDEEVVARIQREAGYFSASTQQALGNSVMQRILNGPDGSIAALTIRTHDGATKEIRVKRSVRTEPDPPKEEEAIKLLPSEIGYVDLSRLEANQLDDVFKKFAAASAIIFDARGPLRFDASLLASRLTGKPDVAGAIVTGPIALTPDLTSPRSITETASFFRVESVPPFPGPVYQGKTVMLIDERTAGRAEHLGLLLEAVNRTAFVGTLSAGADGETAAFVIPGGITITFSTTDVRHANGGKLQRVGLEPSVTVSPALADVRAGRDVILEKAVEYLSNQGVPSEDTSRAAR